MIRAQERNLWMVTKYLVFHTAFDGVDVRVGRESLKAEITTHSILQV